MRKTGYELSLVIILRVQRLHTEIQNGGRKQDSWFLNKLLEKSRHNMKLVRKGSYRFKI